MFDIGFSELLLVGLVALLVLGPERLPIAALKAQVTQELDHEHLLQSIDQQPLRQLEQQLRDGIRLDAPLPETATPKGPPAP
jgi:sec-independent protein translocase protein TatB